MLTSAVLFGSAGCVFGYESIALELDGGPDPDAARPSGDAGAKTPDAGGPTADAGGPRADAGGPTPDAGSDAGSEVDAGGPMPEGCIDSVSAGHHLFACDGIEYDVEVSTACAAGGCGLVLDVHGATMTAGVEDRNTNLRALGAARGYVVVQPTAPTVDDSGTTWVPGTDDAKVLAFLELAIRAFAIDVGRVHMTGFSQGGFMTWRLLCAHADLFASVAPAAACGSLFPGCPFDDVEHPSREIPVLYIHGVDDPVISGCQQAMSDAVVNAWSMTWSAQVSMDDGHTWTRYTSESGNVFEYIEHRYHAFSRTLDGHCLPGSADIGTTTTGWEGFGCVEEAPFAWGEAALGFFEAHPRP